MVAFVFPSAEGGEKGTKLRVGCGREVLPGSREQRKAWCSEEEGLTTLPPATRAGFHSTEEGPKEDERGGFPKNCRVTGGASIASWGPGDGVKHCWEERHSTLFCRSQVPFHHLEESQHWRQLGPGHPGVSIFSLIAGSYCPPATHRRRVKQKSLADRMVWEHS